MHMVDRVRKRWTVEELYSLPEDGNKYEIIHGQLFVTPAPTVSHETITDVVATGSVVWHPPGVSEPLSVSVADVFGLAAADRGSR